MSFGRRFRRGMAYEPPRTTPLSTADRSLDAIVAAAPDVPGYGGGKWAWYGMCCWWTSKPADVGHASPPPWSGRFGPEPTGWTDRPGLPCCPYCGSPLFQAPLEEFVAAAKGDPAHHGVGGLATFVAAHSAPCHRTWDEYVVEAM